MADPITEFARVFAPVLFANLCTVAFVWACVQYSKREQAGLEGQPGSGGYLSTIVAVMLFGLAGIYVAIYG
jgi:fatty acid desaturase